MTVSHEAADMRRHLWVKAPMRVVIDGVAHDAAEWSVGGIAIDRTGRNAASKVDLTTPGRALTLHVALPFQGFDIGFDARGEIESWASATGRAVIGFRDLGQREQELLAHFAEQLLRGNMTPVGETIQRLGLPLAATDTAALPVSGAPSWQRQTLRSAGMTAVYAAAGVAALAYLGSLLYTNLFWLEAPTSTISAPVQSLVSLGDGVVTWTTFKPGDRVHAGDVVLKIADTVLEREIEHAEIAVRERENKLAFLARRFESEKRRLAALAGLSTLKSAHTSAEIETLNVKLQAAQKELRQLPATAVGPLAQVRQRIVGLRQAISLKSLDLSARATLTKENTGSLEFVGQTVVGDMDGLAAQIELAEADIVSAQQRHQSYLNQRNRLSLRAPFDGILRELTQADTATVRKGDVAAVFERADNRGVTAYLRQDQLLRVQLGAEAIVHVPATRQTFKATVTEIDPLHGAQNGRTQHAGGQGAAPRRDDGMAAVRLTVAGSTRPDDLDVYRDGLPAVTMIGLSVVQTPWSTSRASRADANTVTPGRTAGFVAAAATANADTTDRRNWLSRAISGTLSYWGRATRSPAQLGG